jgi:hypothetical protein
MNFFKHGLHASTSRPVTTTKAVQSSSAGLIIVLLPLSLLDTVTYLIICTISGIVVTGPEKYMTHFWTSFTCLRPHNPSISLSPHTTPQSVSVHTQPLNQSQSTHNPSISLSPHTSPSVIFYVVNVCRRLRAVLKFRNFQNREQIVFYMSRRISGEQWNTVSIPHAILTIKLSIK